MQLHSCGKFGHKAEDTIHPKREGQQNKFGRKCMTDNHESNYVFNVKTNTDESLWLLDSATSAQTS